MAKVCYNFFYNKTFMHEKYMKEMCVDHFPLIYNYKVHDLQILVHVTKIQKRRVFA